MKRREYIPDESGIPGKELPFGVPDSYFDRFPARVQERLSGRESPSLRPGIAAFRSRFAMAAVFAGLIALGYAGFRILSEQMNDTYLSGEELRETLEYLAWDLDDELLVYTLDEAGILFQTQSEDDQTEEIIEILSEEDLNFIDLINEN